MKKIYSYNFEIYLGRKKGFQNYTIFPTPDKDPRSKSQLAFCEIREKEYIYTSFNS